MVQSLSRSIDQQIVHHGRSWEQFKLIQKGFEESPGVRLFYYNGTVEILMPGREHEVFGRVIGFLVATFLIKKGIFFQPTGAMTQEKEGEVSAQADESYCGGTTKLARYRALGVAEVWFWQDGALELYHLRSAGYEQIERSELEGLQDLDIDLLRRCVLMAETDTGEAVRVFQREIK
jgi:Uma2 family endonuclease